MTTAAIDPYLALFVRQSMRGGMLPPWPDDWPKTPEFCRQAFDRIAFHGIALVIAEQAEALSQWPVALRDHIQGEARAQSFWEMSHRQVIARLVGALDAAGAASVITKGTALAYSLYSEPALRRRGDSDLLLLDGKRGPLRKLLEATGFRPVGDARPLQESWAYGCPMGFSHVVDLHWQSNASAVISHCFDRAGIGRRTVPLPRISPAARAIAPTDNVILIAINRALHGQFGYVTGADKAFEENRLIWAMDLDLLCASFGSDDWQALIAAVQTSGTAPVVQSALAFAHAALDTSIPAEVTAAIGQQSGDARLLKYLGALPGMARLRLDLSACPTLADKVRLVRYTLLPGGEVLHERFPQAAHWPIPALRVRRLLAGVGKLMLERG